MKPEMKKLIIANLPYLLFVYLFGKLGQAYRLAEGIDLSQKLLHFADGCAAAFESAAPSFHLFDLLIGVAGAAALRLMVYCKGKNAKKYRKGVEYGSARWGGPKDIAPYIDPNFDNNILLTQTERLTMNNRPKDPKTARNKNVLVIGGSGSGKTRFFVKPNLMQSMRSTRRYFSRKQRRNSTRNTRRSPGMRKPPPTLPSTRTIRTAPKRNCKRSRKRFWKKLQP